MNEDITMHPHLNRKFVEENLDALALTNDTFDLPEKVIQFGTGVLLRGLVDYVIDKANKARLFNGSVVVVKSTEGPVTGFIQQDNLYTVLEKGLHSGSALDRKHLITCVSRVLTASTDWDAILQCAANPAIDIVISNTTEAGLVFVDELLDGGTPNSFPAKLTVYLWHRYKIFNGDRHRGMVILPTELRGNNGQLLKSFVLQHAKHNKLPAGFSEWVINSNVFCNTLVDRIVPGKSEKDDLILWNSEVSCIDHLHTKAEPFLLWAIEGNYHSIREKLSFAQIDERIIITESIAGYEEQKLRILNGSNSLVALPAFLEGCNTLIDTVTDQLFASYTMRLIDSEIIPTIIDRCPNATAFAKEVLDRFRNPSIQYKLLNIALQCSSKINSRNRATIIRYYHIFNQFPPLTMIGLAAFCLFYTPKGKKDGTYYGLRNDEPYFFRDEHAEFLCSTLDNIDWLNTKQAQNAVATIFGNDQIFSAELASLPGFSAAVATFCIALQRDGIRNTIQHYLNNN